MEAVWTFCCDLNTEINNAAVVTAKLNSALLHWLHVEDCNRAHTFFCSAYSSSVSEHLLIVFKCALHMLLYFVVSRRNIQAELPTYVTATESVHVKTVCRLLCYLMYIHGFRWSRRIVGVLRDKALLRLGRCPCSWVDGLGHVVRVIWREVAMVHSVAR